MIGLVVAGGDPAKVLDGAEEVFDEVTPAIHREVARDVGLAIGLGRNHGEGAAFVEFAAKPIIVEALVADQRADGDAIEQRLNAVAVMPLARQEDETREIAQRVDQGRRFWWSGRRASVRSPDFESPFCARPVLVDADDGSVDERVFEIRIAA